MNKLLEWCFKTETEGMLPLLAERLERTTGVRCQSGSMYCYQPGDIPILMVAHVDTVHQGMPRDLFFDQVQGVLWSPDGCGADDRAGVYGILNLIDRGYRPHVLFTDEEERGGLGAEQAARLLDAPDVNLMIQLDRMNADDAVWYSCDNGKARKWVNRFGFQTAQGSFTDISVLMPEWRVAGCNLSVGYYNQHSDREFLRVPELLATLDKVSAMLENPPPKRFHYHEGRRKLRVNFNRFMSHSTWDMELANLALEELKGEQEAKQAEWHCDLCDGWFACEDLADHNGDSLCNDCLAHLYGEIT